MIGVQGRERGGWGRGKGRKTIVANLLANGRVAAPLPLSHPALSRWRSAVNRDGVCLKRGSFLPSDWLQSVSFPLPQYLTYPFAKDDLISAL